MLKPLQTENENILFAIVIGDMSTWNVFFQRLNDGNKDSSFLKKIIIYIFKGKALKG